MKRKNAERRKFSTEEDELIRDLVLNKGMKKWSDVALRLNDRSPRQCRDRWKNYLSPSIQNAEWTPSDDSTLCNLISQFGPQFAKIAKFMPGRTDVNIKNRWSQMQRYWKRVSDTDKSRVYDSAIDHNGELEDILIKESDLNLFQTSHLNYPLMVSTVANITNVTNGANNIINNNNAHVSNQILTSQQPPQINPQTNPNKVPTYDFEYFADNPMMIYQQHQLYAQQQQQQQIRMQLQIQQQQYQQHFQQQIQQISQQPQTLIQMPLSNQQHSNTPPNAVMALELQNKQPRQQIFEPVNRHQRIPEKFDQTITQNIYNGNNSTTPILSTPTVQKHNHFEQQQIPQQQIPQQQIPQQQIQQQQIQQQQIQQQQIQQQQIQQQQIQQQAEIRKDGTPTETKERKETKETTVGTTDDRKNCTAATVKEPIPLVHFDIDFFSLDEDELDAEEPQRTNPPAKSIAWL